MSHSIVQPTKESYVLVEMRYGDVDNPQYIRFTDWTKRTAFQNSWFESLPNMEIKIPTYTALFKEKPLKILVPLNSHPDLVLLSSGQSWSPIFVTVWEVIASDNIEKEFNILYYGRVFRTVRNPSRRTDLVRIECKNLKAELEISLGSPANAECIWFFGGNGCFYKNRQEIQVTVASILGTVITLAAPLAALPVIGGGFGTWTKGHVRRNGIVLGVKGWDGESADPNILSTLNCTRSVPLEWNGQTITLREGCTKTLVRCQNYDNEEHFAGIGRASPQYNPVLESNTTPSG